MKVGFIHAGGEMLPVKLLEDLTGTPLRLSPPQE
jgi:hypothetical protein